ncbi:Zinc finger protein OZF, partial [Frankliniella fusca]
MSLPVQFRVLVLNLSGAPRAAASRPPPGDHVCATCGKRFRHRTSLCKHQHVHRGTTVCALCGATLSSIDYLRRHVEAVHGERVHAEWGLVPAEAVHGDTAAASDPADAAPAAAPAAVPAASTASATASGAAPASKAAIVHRQRDFNRPRPFVCRVCGKGFSHCSSLAKHRFVHEEGTRCPLCARSYNRRMYLKEHLLGVHGLTPQQVAEYLKSDSRVPLTTYSTTTTFTTTYYHPSIPTSPRPGLTLCGVAEYFLETAPSFGSSLLGSPPPSASGSVSGSGPGSGRYECALCGKAFHARRSLRQHVSVHKGATRCPICYTVLSRRAHLFRHMSAVHNVQVQ